MGWRRLKVLAGLKFRPVSASTGAAAAVCRLCVVGAGL
jgi:hypothetical protein